MEGTDASREQHHVRGHRAILTLEDQGVAAVAEALNDLVELIRVVEEGSIPPTQQEREKEQPISSPPPLGPYLSRHSDEIHKLNVRLIEIGAKIKENLISLRQTLY